MIHNLKIEQCHLCHILEGTKTFQLRKNDRDFQVGDSIHFLPLEDKNYNAYEIMSPIPNFRINYVMSDFVGLEKGYVVLAITPIKNQ